MGNGSNRLLPLTQTLMKLQQRTVNQKNLKNDQSNKLFSCGILCPCSCYALTFQDGTQKKWHFFLSSFLLQYIYKGMQNQLDVKEGMQKRDNQELLKIDNTPIPSGHNADYQNLLKDAQIKCSLVAQRLNDELIYYLRENYQISYDEKNFREKLECSIEYETPNSEVIKLNVFYGNFSLYFLIINVDQNSLSDSLTHLVAGNFGNVYQAYTKNKKFAIKSIPIAENKFQESMIDVMKELFILRVASALRIGPRFDNIYGFDIILYRNAIEFSMEFCDSPRENDSNTLKEHLKDKLGLLHRCHIVHSDIKPQNIAFSRYYDEYVFIDFGLSRIIKEDIGEKTFTSFIGSIQYCSPQMCQIYVRQVSNRVDLYYNDAIGLSKTIQVFQQPREDVVEEFQHQIKLNLTKNPHKFYKVQQIVLLKYLFFGISLSPMKRIRLNEQFQRMMDENSEVIGKFMRILPYSSLAAQLYAKYCQREEEGLSYEKKAQTGWIFSKKKDGYFQNTPSLFIDRVSKLNGLCSMASSQQSGTGSLANDDQVISEGKQKQQLLRLIKIIKINGESDFLDDKVNLCKKYTLFRLMVSQDDPNKLQFYKSVIQIIFNYSLNQFDESKGQIMKHVIQTIFILQIISEQQLIGAFKTVIKAQLIFIDKIRLVYQFLVALEFPKNKFRSKYNYERVTQAFICQLNNFLDTFINKQTLNIDEAVIFNRLKQIIVEKMDYGLQNIKDKSSLSPQLLSNFSIFTSTPEKKLIHDLQVYLIYNEACITFSLYNWIGSFNVDYLSKEITKGYSHPNIFTFIHLILYQQALTKNHHTLILMNYRLFLTQMLPFSEHKNFKMYLRHIFYVLKCRISKFLPLQPDSNRQSAQYQQITINKAFSLIEEIVLVSSQFHQYVFTLIQLAISYRFNAYFMNKMKHFLKANKDKIFAFVKYYHKNSIYHHNNRLRNQITVIYNSMLLVDTLELQQASQIFNNFLKDASMAVQNSTCFVCKITCFIEIRIIECLYQSKLGKIQQSIHTLLDLLSLCAKNNQQLHLEIGRIVQEIVKIWQISKEITRKYNINTFLFNIAKQYNIFSVCLSQSCGLSIFSKLYIEIALNQDYAQLANFVIGMTKHVTQLKSIQLSVTFYNQLCQAFFIVGKEAKSMMQFKYLHEKIVEYLLQSKQSINLPYIALYFSAVLIIHIKESIGRNMIQIIKASLGRIDNYSKDLLLKTYYHHFVYYFQCSCRKLRFLYQKHLKFNLSEIESFGKDTKLKEKSKKCHRHNNPKLMKLLKQKKNMYYKRGNNVIRTKSRRQIKAEIL